MGAITFTIGQLVLYTIFLVWWGYILNNTVNKDKYNYTAFESFMEVVWWIMTTGIAIAGVVSFFTYLV